GHHPPAIPGGVGGNLIPHHPRAFMTTFTIIYQPIKAGPQFDNAAMANALRPAATAQLLAMADEFYERFKSVVRQRRPQLNLAEGTSLDGRVFTARQALEPGPIDRIGYLEYALAEARLLARQPAARVVLFHRRNDPGWTPYATTPNIPLQAALLPYSMPGADRSRLPLFLYLWQPDPTLDRLSGK